MSDNVQTEASVSEQTGTNDEAGRIFPSVEAFHEAYPADGETKPYVVAGSDGETLYVVAAKTPQVAASIAFAQEGYTVTLGVERRRGGGNGGYASVFGKLAGMTPEERDEYIRKMNEKYAKPADGDSTEPTTDTGRDEFGFPNSYEDPAEKSSEPASPPSVPDAPKEKKGLGKKLGKK